MLDYQFTGKIVASRFACVIVLLPVIEIFVYTHTHMYSSCYHECTISGPILGQNFHLCTALHWLLFTQKYPSVSSLTNACPHHRFPFSLQSVRETVLRNFHVWGCRIYIKNISLDLKSPDRNCGYGIAGMIL